MTYMYNHIYIYTVYIRVYIYILLLFSDITSVQICPASRSKWYPSVPCSKLEHNLCSKTPGPQAQGPLDVWGLRCWKPCELTNKAQNHNTYKTMYTVYVYIYCIYIYIYTYIYIYMCVCVRVTMHLHTTCLRPWASARTKTIWSSPRQRAKPAPRRKPWVGTVATNAEVYPKI